MTWLVLASLALLVVALVLGRRARSSADALGLAGDLVYRDTGVCDELLVSDAHGLAGRPDYILRAGGEFIYVMMEYSLSGDHSKNPAR